jgi:hypothetical protein
MKYRKLELPGELSQEGAERFGNGLQLFLFFMVSHEKNIIGFRIYLSA